jgi:hypothetical protein
MTSSEIPYEDHELNNNSNSHIQNNSNRNDGGNGNGNTTTTTNNNGSSASASAENAENAENTEKLLQLQLALIPLHPACKKQKGEAKKLPIVLGRTNLAAWWWKSCPCQHYCRLHCRPVAQNIRSLSKVMIQIDTAGKVHLVGKNPHLITVTPEREDNLLLVNDILSIGRRDREPWMRFQVVRKPSNENRPPRQQKAHPPNWMTNHTSSSGNKAASAIRVRKSSGRKSTSPTGTNNPPEWITTTRKRKSSSSRASSSTRQKLQQQQRVITKRLEEAAAAAASETFHQKDGDASSHDSDSNEPARKRRRNRETTEKKSARQRSRTDVRKTEDIQQQEQGTGTGTANKSDKQIIASGPTAPAGGEKYRHPQVHLVFQDYGTSASLLQATQRKRKRDDDTSRNINLNPLSAAPGAFVVDKSQLRLLSRNFAAALLGAVAPTSTTNDPQSAPYVDVAVVAAAATAADSGEVVANNNQQESQQAKTTEAMPASAASRKPKTREHEATNESTDINGGGNQEESVATNTPKEDKCEAKSEDLKMTPSNSSKEQLVPAGIPDDEEEEESNVQSPSKNPSNKETQQEASMLSLPQCASSSFEPGQGDAQEEAESGRTARSSNNSGDESECSSPSAHPVADLEPWRDMVAEEQERGNTSSFRHALASLIVAKNEKQNRNENGPLWLPSLLEDDFQIEHPND